MTGLIFLALFAVFAVALDVNKADYLKAPVQHTSSCIGNECNTVYPVCAVGTPFTINKDSVFWTFKSSSSSDAKSIAETPEVSNVKYFEKVTAPSAEKCAIPEDYDCSYNINGTQKTQTCTRYIETDCNIDRTEWKSIDMDSYSKTLNPGECTDIKIQGSVSPGMWVDNIPNIKISDTVYSFPEYAVWNATGWGSSASLTISCSDPKGCPANYTVELKINTTKYYNESLLQSDCDDLRIVDQSTNTVDFTYGYAWNKSTCYTSDASQLTVLTFKLQRNISLNATSTDYVLWYNNPSASQHNNPRNYNLTHAFWTNNSVSNYVLTSGCGATSATAVSVNTGTGRVSVVDRPPVASAPQGGYIPIRPDINMNSSYVIYVNSSTDNSGDAYIQAGFMSSATPKHEWDSQCADGITTPSGTYYTGVSNPPQYGSYAVPNVRSSAILNPNGNNFGFTVVGGTYYAEVFKREPDNVTFTRTYGAAPNITSTFGGRGFNFTQNGQYFQSFFVGVSLDGQAAQEPGSVSEAALAGTPLHTITLGSSSTSSINANTYNVTSAISNGTLWRTSTTIAINTTDPTPTVTFNTTQVTNCSISKTNLNYSLMVANDSTTQCGTVNSTGMTCTVPDSQALSLGNQNLYIACRSASGDDLNNSGPLSITFIVSEDTVRSIIETAVNNKLGNPTIYTDQQIYIRRLNGTQVLGTFDKVAVSGQQRWAFNYLTGSDVFQNLGNMSPVLYTYEVANISTTQLQTDIEALIISTQN